MEKNKYAVEKNKYAVVEECSDNFRQHLDGIRNHIVQTEKQLAEIKETETEHPEVAFMGVKAELLMKILSEFPFGSGTCPYCEYYEFDSTGTRACRGCEWGEMHGKCDVDGENLWTEILRAKKNFKDLLLKYGFEVPIIKGTHFETKDEFVVGLGKSVIIITDKDGNILIKMKRENNYTFPWTIYLSPTLSEQNSNVFYKSEDRRDYSDIKYTDVLDGRNKHEQICVLQNRNELCIATKDKYLLAINKINGFIRFSSAQQNVFETTVESGHKVKVTRNI